MSYVYDIITRIIVVGGSSTTIAYFAFKFLAKKWIEHQFAIQLKENEYRINSLFNRITKIHEKEFEVLPEAWKRLLDAYSKIVHTTHPLQTLPDLDAMPDREFEDYLKNSNLSDLHKDDLRSSKNKNDLYKILEYRYTFIDSQKLISEFHDYIHYNKIFLSTDLYNKFKEIDDVLKAALQVWEDGKEHEDYHKLIEAYNKINENCERIINEIEDMVQKRLHFEDAV